jgi:hypothetical protein
VLPTAWRNEVPKLRLAPSSMARTFRGVVLPVFHCFCNETRSLGRLPDCDTQLGRSSAVKFSLTFGASASVVALDSSRAKEAAHERC